MHIGRSGWLRRLTRRCLGLSHFPVLTNDSGDHRSGLHPAFGSDRLHHCLLGFVSTSSRHQAYLGRAWLLSVNFGYPFPHGPKSPGRVSSPQPCHAGLFYGKRVPYPVGTPCDFQLPVGLAIYAWLIATSPHLRRWLGVMMGVQAVLLFIALGAFIFPHLSDFVASQLFTLYAIILSVAEAVWFLSPVGRKPNFN
jgi:hypothetical protein